MSLSYLLVKLDNLNLPQRLGRQMIETYLGTDKIYDFIDWKEYSVPPDRLQLFLQTPSQYGPKAGEMIFDISESSPSEMANAPWNRTIVHQLASRAQETFNQNPGLYTSGDETIDWNSLFKERIYRIILSLHKAKNGVLESQHEFQKSQNQKRRTRVSVCILHPSIFHIFTRLAEI